MHVFSNAKEDIEQRQKQRQKEKESRRELAAAVFFTVITYVIWVLGMKAVNDGALSGVTFIEGDTLVWGLTVLSAVVAIVSWDIYRMSRKACK